MFGWFSNRSALLLDLAQERQRFLALFASGVRSFRSSVTGKDIAPITRVDIKYDLTSEAYPRVWLEADTEPSGEPRTGRAEIYQIVEQECRSWAAPCHATLEGKKVRVRTHAGLVVVNTETELCTAVGLYFVDLMQSLCKAGLFKSLLRAAECYVGVATEDGEYGWPDWEQWRNWKV